MNNNSDSKFKWIFDDKEHSFSPKPNTLAIVKPETILHNVTPVNYGERTILKFIIEFTSKTLDTDIKSIKKAARKGIQEELIKRSRIIIDQKKIELKDDNKIYWNNYPIAKVKKGMDYLSPEIEITADDSLPLSDKNELENFIKGWINSYIVNVLGDLINLTKIKIEDQYLRALSFQLFENNGILKRTDINQIINLISKEERKKLWGMGVKIGRYHIYLPKMLKPKAVTLRVNLWKLYYDISSTTNIPKFGLNFLNNEKFNKKILLLCGFEKFEDFFVRVDILEKLFIDIIDSSKDRKFKITSKMINLLGCTKENFYKLMLLMDYKKDKEEDVYIFNGEKKKFKKEFKIKRNASPFDKLLTLNIK